MSKKKKKKKKKKLKNFKKQNLSFSEIEKIAISSVKKKNYIVALNHFKMLPAENRQRHRDLIAKCYVNAIDIYIKEDNLAKAENNIQQFIKLAGEDCCLFQQLQMALKKKNFGETLHFSKKILLQPAEKLIKLTRKEISNLADILIISFEDAKIIDNYSNQLYKNILAYF